MDFWHRWIARGCRVLYYSRLAVLCGDRLPATGPVLYVALHRNGAVDGFVYASVVPRAVAMISTQLRRSALARLFFTGIEVVRDKDRGDREHNRQALDDCLALLERGGELAVLPEGSSTLGPRHLPFHRGAARIAVEAVGRGIPLTVVPLAIHYERAWAFRSRVEVVVGPAVDTRIDAGLAPESRVAEMHRRISQALEAIATQFDSCEQQAEAEQLAYVATLATSRSYYESLKRLERGIPPSLQATARDLETRLGGRRVLRHQGVPLVPMGPLPAYAALLVLLSPLVAAAAVLNAVPLGAAWLAGCRLADDRNVIALWRVLVGVPCGVLWLAAVGAGAAASGATAAFVAYAAVTIGGWLAWYRFKKLAVATVNGLLHPDLRQPLLAFRLQVLRELGHAD